jgi:diaminopimelate decarboxylase
MQPFSYKNGQLYIENTALDDIAIAAGTPCYVYSRAAIIQNWQQFKSALHGHPHQICYAVKANPSLSILNLIAGLGSGFDVVSGGELARVIAAGGRADKTVFSGIGKTASEISQALDAGIQCFNVESGSELSRINQIATEKGVIAPVALRINPDVDAKTHPHITTGLYENKFGIPMGEIQHLLELLDKMTNVRLDGIGFHIGSQLTTLEPFIAATDALLALAGEIRRPLRHIDFGGGLGVCYDNEILPSIFEYVGAICGKMQGLSQTVILEPGRALVANAGILLTRVEYIKRTPHKNFVIVDAGMNDLLRPALYDAWHRITPVSELKNIQEETADIVGPVCETADFLGKDRKICTMPGALLAIHTAGAYGASMGSNYNSRPRPPEVLVDGETFHLIRAREKISDLFHHEILLNPVTCP